MPTPTLDQIGVRQEGRSAQERLKRPTTRTKTGPSPTGSRRRRRIDTATLLRSRLTPSAKDASPPLDGLARGSGDQVEEHRPSVVTPGVAPRVIVQVAHWRILPPTHVSSITTEPVSGPWSSSATIFWARSG